MSAKGKGTSQSNTQSVSNTTNIQETTNNVDNRIYSTTVDAGAVSGAIDIGRDALDLAGNLFEGASGVANAAIDANATLADASSERIARFAGDALDSQAGLAGDAITALQDAGAGVLDFVGQLFDKSLTAQQTLTDQSNAAVAKLATQNTATSDDRFTKLVTVVVIAAAAAFILPKVIK